MKKTERTIAPEIETTSLAAGFKGSVRRGGLFLKIFMLLLSFSLIMVLLYMADYIPRQKKGLLKAIESEARSVSASISQVCGNAVVGEDYGFIVEHNMGVLKNTAGIRYIAVVRKNGFTLIHTPDGWQQLDLPGKEWALDEKTPQQGEITWSDFVGAEVYRYSYPLVYSGLRWGHLQLGLSLDNLNDEIKYLYRSILTIAVLFLFIGVLGAYFLARRLTGPIYALLDTTTKISGGDLSARAMAGGSDELSDLARAFNQMTEALAKTTISRDYLTSILSNMSDTLIVSSPAGQIEMVNQAGIDLLGYAPTKIETMNLNQLFLGKKLNGPPIDLKTLIQERSVRNQECFCRVASGKFIPVLFSGSVMVAKNGAISGVVCAFIDITKRKHDEVELKKAMLASQKASIAKSEFLANMSHELRTPLNHIIGFTELVVDGHAGKINAKQDEFLKDALASGNHLLTLINDILDISKVEAGKLTLKKEKVQLSSLIDSGMRMVQEQSVKKGIDISVRFNGAPDFIWADDRKVRQIIYNLLSNAVKFTPKNGKIQIYADHLVLSDGNLIKENGSILKHLPFSKDDLKNHDTYMGVSILDNGIGIASRDKAKIFQPFEQIDSSASRKYQGTGLGLALVKQLVELHHGKIWVDSRGLGLGSTFTFILPVKQE